MADMIRLRQLALIEDKFDAISKEDRIEAVLAIEEDMGNVRVNCKYKWNSCLFSKLPTSLLPKTEVNAEMINEILVKSWETQGSVLQSKPDRVLATNLCFDINGLLMHYFKCLNVAENMKRVVGLSGWIDECKVVHSFLKVGELIIDNTFCEEITISMQESPDYFGIASSFEYYDVDPADPEYTVNPESSQVGLKNERLVNGKDEKLEQYLMVNTGYNYVNKLLYDKLMRKFIKEKYGVEIESLANKWIKLCWNCFAATEELRKCPKCKVARYCGEDCQKQDWKIHKILHR